MAYEKTTWISGQTPLSATNMNKIENALEELSNRSSGSNPNLLINGDFQVWQRGEEITIIDGQYLCDRWRMYYLNGNVTFKKVDDGIQIVSVTDTSKTVSIYQPIEYNHALENKEGMFSYSVNGVTTTKPHTITKVGTVENPYLDVPYITGLKIGDVINWAKFELGSITTPFSPRPYAEEWLLCQRYYQVHEVLWLRRTHNNWAKFYLPTKMRTAPTLTGTFKQYSMAGTEWGTIATGDIYTKYNQIDIYGTGTSDWYVASDKITCDSEIY